MNEVKKTISTFKYDVTDVNLREYTSGWVEIHTSMKGTNLVGLWQFKCDETGFIALIYLNKDKDSNYNMLEKILLEPMHLYLNDCVFIQDMKKNEIAQWHPSNGIFHINGEFNDLQTYGGYGLRQAMRLIFLMLSEAGLLTDEGIMK